jgi:hypothetical protein
MAREKRAGRDGPAKWIREAKRLGDGRVADPALLSAEAWSEAATAEGVGHLQHDRPEPRSYCTAAFRVLTQLGQTRHGKEGAPRSVVRAKA